MKTQTVDGMNVASPGFGWCGRHLMGFLWALGSMILPAQHAVGADGLLANPGFESDFAGWTVSGNAWVRSTTPYRAAEGARLVAFNTANTAPNGVLSQTFNTVPGQTYGVSFALGVLAYNRNSQVLGVDARGTTMRASKTYALTNSSHGIRWVTRGFQFIADSSRTTLFFRDRSTATASIDLLLDAVMVTPPPAHSLTVDVSPTAAEIVLSPPDQAGNSNGNAGAGFGPLSRVYSPGTEVTVTVPELLWSSSYPDKALVYRFTGWTLDGNPAGTDPSIRVTMNGNRSLMAGYAPSPPIITRQPEDVVVPYGGTATFTVEAIGSSNMNYEWKFTQRLPLGYPGQWTFQNGPSNMAVLTNVGSDYDGVYEVIVSNAAGSTRSRGATLLTVGYRISNGDFESGYQDPAGTLAGWTVAGNVRAQSAPTEVSPEGHAAAFNTGNSVPNGSLEQYVATQPGATYLLRFDLGALAYNTSEQRMGVTVTGTSTVADGVTAVRGRGYGRTWWEIKSMFFTADSEVSKIRFSDRSSATNAIDMLLDNVRIDRIGEGYAVIPAGTFQMGSPPDEIGRFFNEGLHQVTLTRSYLMKRTEMTWDQWNSLRIQAATYGYNDIGTGMRGSDGLRGGDHPVTFVTWWDAVKWCNLASEIAGLRPVYYIHPAFEAGQILRSGKTTVFADWSAGGYRLPTTAEWEHACRAGTTTAFHTGASNNPDRWGPDPMMDLAGWYVHNSGGMTHAVATKAANPWGLHDMHGNVWEWCWDYFPWPDSSASEPAAVDPRGPAASSGHRTHRGGCYNNNADNCRSALRHGNGADGSNQGEGFRPVLNAGP